MGLLRRVVLWGSCLVLLVSLGGCVYLRIAKVKQQLGCFDENVEIIEDEYFSIVFKQGFLLPEDIVWLMKQAPTSQECVGDGLIYNYVLVKQYPAEKDEEGNYDLPIRYVFKAGVFVRVDLDKKYLAMFSKKFITLLLKAMGKAKVDLVNKSANADYKEKWDSGIMDLPDVNDIVMALGKAYDVNDNVYTWKYLHKKSTEDNADDKYSTGQITFDKESGKIMKASSELYGQGYCMDFSSLFEAENAKSSEEAGSGDKGN